MHYYIEITVLPDDDAALHFLWSKLYTQLHIAFAEHKDEKDLVPYGVSFPEYKVGKKAKGEVYFTPGSKLRVFAESEALLEALNLEQWFDRLRDYLHLKSIQAVPKKALRYFTFERIRPKDDKLKRIQHQAKRRNISLEESAKYFENYEETPLDTPYIRLKSLSSDSIFNLFIQRQPATQQLQGKFTTYGLSKSSTVPDWSN